MTTSHRTFQLAQTYTPASSFLSLVSSEHSQLPTNVTLEQKPHYNV